MKTVPILTSISSDGTVTISINQVGYTYHLDAGFIPEIQRLFEHKPWSGLNLTKKKAYHFTKTLLNQREVKPYEVQFLRL